MKTQSFLKLAKKYAMTTTTRGSPSADLVAWVSFGKTGSTSLRYALRERAQRHQWPVWPKPRCICREDFTPLLHAPRSASRRLRCEGMPAGYVIETPATYGYCELRSLRRQGCTYMTLLREPMARVVSAWNYYCLRCAEGSCLSRAQRVQNAAYNAGLQRFDHRPAAPNSGTSRPRNACPNMSLVAYASLEGNRYTRTFAHAALLRGRNATHQPGQLGRVPMAPSPVRPVPLAPPPPSARNGEDRSTRAREDAREDEEAALLSQAMATLRRPEMLVIFTEALDTSDWRALARHLGEDANASAWRRARHMHASGARPRARPRHEREGPPDMLANMPWEGEAHGPVSARDLELLGRILRLDIALYRAALDAAQHVRALLRAAAPGAGPAA